MEARDEAEPPAAWLTVAEAGEILGLTPKKVYLRASPATPAEARIPCYRLGAKGGKLRFRREDLVAYLSEAWRPASEPPPRPLLIREVAEILGVNRCRVETLIRNFRLRCSQVGDPKGDWTYRITPEDLAEFRRAAPGWPSE